ncbi:MAG: hypothetical protein CSB44_00680 [Gammaproteobacteria bacterium]|nr:MAG: hypothetical protein CSB44_00680 [Gammaproteobacteria bacterium]
MGDDESLGHRERLNLETGRISWDELARFFARGVVIHVAAGMDLVEVAECLSRDDVPTLEGWLNAGRVARASDDDARAWTAANTEFWCVVVAPWVVVQELDPEQAAEVTPAGAPIAAG